jgi:carbonic anhydrase/acetyltransferase-like protein (isoleucine patch superfamily)
MKKYILRTDLKLKVGFTTLYRIERTSDNQLGGYIESEKNLSQSGDAWVSGNARVYGNAQVSGDAWVSGNARVYGNAWVHGNARVYGDARVCGNAQVYGNARVHGDARVYGNARVSGDARVYGDAIIDSLSAIIILVIAMKYSVTITRQYVAIGCQTFKREDIKNITPDQAAEKGLPKEFLEGYRQMILGAMKLVKRKKD